MESKSEDIKDKPPFFKQWKGIYLFLIGFEVLLILLFVWITNNYNG